MSESTPPKGPGRAGKLSRLQRSGRLDALLESGGVRYASAPEPAAPQTGAGQTGAPPAADRPAPPAAVPPPPSLRSELSRVFRRDERRRTAFEQAEGLTGAPVPLEEVVERLDPRPTLHRHVREEGRVTTLTWRYPLDDRHGGVRYRDALGAPTGNLAAALRDPRLEDFRPNRALFLDIESTGLSHAAGTCAFLVGLAWFEADALVLELLLLERMEDEAALLAHFVERRDSREFLVSFNGRCYDVNVLQSRLVLNRVWDDATTELRTTPHVDLLHLSRAIHGGRFADNRLQTMERELFSIRRVGDIPGELIPGIYFRYLRTDDCTRLEPVLRHNAIDVLSMVSLLADLCWALDDDGAAAGAHVQANLARLWKSRKQPARSARILDALFGQPPALPQLPQDITVRALLDRVDVLKKELRALPPTERAPLVTATQWTLGQLARRPDTRFQAYTELALLHDRHTRDRERALDYARRALTALPKTATTDQREKAQRRVDRLARREG